MNKYFFCISLACVFLCSCKDEYTICNESKYSILNGTFFKRTTAGDSTLKVPALSVVNLANNSVIYNQQQGIGSISLPLSTVSDSAFFSIKYAAAAATDTITIKYTSSQEYLSLECGSIDVFNITNIKYTNHRIDTIKIVDPAVRNRSTNNLKIYF